MGDGLELNVLLARAAIVQQEDRAIPIGEEVFESQNLPAVAERVAREQADLGQRVQNYAARLQTIHFLENVLCGVLEFHVGRMERGILILGPKTILGGREFVNGNVFERPPVGTGYFLDLLFRFGQRYVEDALTPDSPIHQELKPESSFSSS